MPSLSLFTSSSWALQPFPNSSQPIFLWFFFQFCSPSPRLPLQHELGHRAPSGQGKAFHRPGAPRKDLPISDTSYSPATSWRSNTWKKWKLCSRPDRATVTATQSCSREMSAVSSGPWRCLGWRYLVCLSTAAPSPVTHSLSRCPQPRNSAKSAPYRTNAPEEPTTP